MGSGACVPSVRFLAYFPIRISTNVFRRQLTHIWNGQIECVREKERERELKREGSICAENKRRVHTRTQFNGTFDSVSFGLTHHTHTHTRTQSVVQRQHDPIYQHNWKYTSIFFLVVRLILPQNSFYVVNFVV